MFREKRSMIKQNTSIRTGKSDEHISREEKTRASSCRAHRSDSHLLVSIIVLLTGTAVKEAPNSFLRRNIKATCFRDDAF